MNLKEHLAKFRESQRRSLVSKSVGKSFLNIGTKLPILEHAAIWYKLVFVPFTITQPWYASLRRSNGIPTGLPVGCFDAWLELPLHKYIGPANNTVLCLQSAFAKLCPICQKRAEYSWNSEGDRKTIRRLRASWRSYYNVFDLNTKKLSFFEASRFCLAENLVEYVLSKSAENDPIILGDPEEPYNFEFRGSRNSIEGGTEFFEFKDFGHRRRKDPLPEKLLAAAVSLDALVRIPTWSDVHEIFYGVDSLEKSSEAPVVLQIDDEDPSVESRGVQSPGVSLLDDEDGMDRPDDSVEDIPIEDLSIKESGDLKSDKPRRGRPRKEEESPEPRPVASPRGAKKDAICPSNHSFGDDTDEYDECDVCPLYDGCIVEFTKRHSS